MGVAKWQSEGYGDGNDATMAQNTWYTYLGSQNLEGTPAAEGDNAYYTNGYQYKGRLNLRLAPNETYEIRQTTRVNGVYYSKTITVVVGASAYVDEINMASEAIEIDIRCTSSANGEVRYDYCVERASRC